MNFCDGCVMEDPTRDGCLFREIKNGQCVNKTANVRQKAAAHENVGYAPDIKKVEEACQRLLDSLLIDTKNDPNTMETAKRMAKMYVEEALRGRYTSCPDVKSFPCSEGAYYPYAVGPITIRSLCSHHMVPIVGKVWVVVDPGESVLGLSKFARLADWIFRRPQIQEQATLQLAELLIEKSGAKGIAVFAKAKHLCMSWRGVQDEEAEMVTYNFCGSFQETLDLKTAAFDLVRAKGF